jgi:hypothetical protein
MDISLVNLFEITLSSLANKVVVHYNLDLHPKKENMEHSDNCERQKNGNIVVGVLVDLDFKLLLLLLPFARELQRNVRKSSLMLL